MRPSNDVRSTPAVLVVGWLLVLTVVGIAAVFASRLDPVAWNPEDPPAMEGPLARNDELTECDRVVSVDGPEDVAFDAEGRLYTGAEDGCVYRTVEPVEAETTDARVEVFARTDGRPLAVEFDGDDLLVAAIGSGLLSVGPDGSVTTLVDRAGGQDVGFANDVHVAQDGTVYVTDATVHGIYEDELFELRDTGRLLAYHPDDGETTVEHDGLGFANGLVPGPDGDSLLINETSRYRVTRYWIDGPREGEAEPFAENLVGYPDNVDVHDDGTYWIAVPALRVSLLDRIHRHPWLVRQFGRLPQWVVEHVSPEPYGLVLRVDGEGSVVESLHDPTGEVFYVTSATPHQGALYLGTLTGDTVWRFSLE